VDILAAAYVFRATLLDMAPFCLLVRLGERLARLVSRPQVPQ
jgi:hypothetical protein